MPFRGRRPIRRSSKPLHPTKWCALADHVETVPAGNSNLITICTADVFEEFTNPTIVRIRGSIEWNMGRGSNDAAEGIRIATGIRTVEESFLLGNLQSLLTNDGAEGPWMWLGYTRLTSLMQPNVYWNTQTNTAVTVSRPYHLAGASEQRFEIDVRAMRRVPQNTKLVLAYTSETSVVTTPDITLSAYLRVLVKE